MPFSRLPVGATRALPHGKPSETTWSSPQNYPTEDREKLGYALVPISHWLKFLIENINSSAILVYP